ncbi:hypothetical protein D8I24_3788 [Cupriavidus necator H850]|nr:hypothetical protein D8I24_3788 [Cupriavidus necator H850]
MHGNGPRASEWPVARAVACNPRLRTSRCTACTYRAPCARHALVASSHGVPPVPLVRRFREEYVKGPCAPILRMDQMAQQKDRAGSSFWRFTQETEPKRAPP